MKTQTERLREHLDKGKSITRLNAYRELGIFELSARIVGLQKNGYQIKKEWIKVSNRCKETVSVVRYSKGVCDCKFVVTKTGSKCSICGDELPF
jgi:hypothetical protein